MLQPRLCVARYCPQIKSSFVQKWTASKTITPKLGVGLGLGLSLGIVFGFGLGLGLGLG